MIRVVKDLFGGAINPLTKLPDKIYRFTMINKNKMEAQVITYGSTITGLKVPDIRGKVDDIVLGMDSVPKYQVESNPYMGASIGRVFGPIRDAKFPIMGEEGSIKVSKNYLGMHHKNGGTLSIDKMHWDIVEENRDGVTLSVCAPEDDQGYPGILRICCKFKLTPDNEFMVSYTASCTDPTPCNLACNPFFNLAGHSAGKKELMKHCVYIAAGKTVIKDKHCIPTGKLLNVSKTPFDLRNWKNIEKGIECLDTEGYDDYFCVNLNGKKPTTVAKVFHPTSGRLMEVVSNQPAVYFYTAQHFPDICKGKPATLIGKKEAHYEKHGAFTMTPCGFPDAVNHKTFPSVWLSPDKQYTHEFTLKFTVKHP